MGLLVGHGTLLLGLRCIAYASARSLIRRTLIDEPPTNLRTVEVFGGFSWSKGCMCTSNRVIAVLLARLRAGHTPLLRAYANPLDLSADTPVSPLQREAADDRTLVTEVPQARCN